MAEDKIEVLKGNTLCAQLTGGVLLSPNDLCHLSKFGDISSDVVCLWLVKPPHFVITMLNQPVVFKKTNP